MSYEIRIREKKTKSKIKIPENYENKRKNHFYMKDLLPDSGFYNESNKQLFQRINIQSKLSNDFSEFGGRWLKFFLELCVFFFL